MGRLLDWDTQDVTLVTTLGLPKYSNRSELFRQRGRAACLLHYVKLHLDDAALDHSQTLRRRLRQVDDAPGNIRPSVIDADHDRAPVGDVRYAQAGANGSVGCAAVIAWVLNLSPLAVHSSSL